MAWPYLAGMVKIVVTYGYNGTPSINVHFVLEREPSSPVPPAVLLAAANSFQDAYANEWKNQMGDEWAINNIVAQDWSLPDGQQIQTSLQLPIDGSEIGLAIPASVALVVSHRTDRTGRSRRGRTYLPGLTEGNTAFNTADADAVIEAADTFDVLDTNLDLQDLDHVVYSLYSGGVAREVPVATVVTNRIVNNRVDTQRRRLPT